MVSIRSLAGETHDDVHKVILGYIGMTIIRRLAEVAWPVLLSALVGQGITTSLAFAAFVLGKAVNDPAQRAQIRTLLNIPYLATDHILPKSAVTWLLFLDVITSAWNCQFIPGLAPGGWGWSLWSWTTGRLCPIQARRACRIMQICCIA